MQNSSNEKGSDEQKKMLPTERFAKNRNIILSVIVVGIFMGAFQVFIGTTNLSGGVSQQFLTGIDSTFVSSILLLLIAASYPILAEKTSGDKPKRTAKPLRLSSPCLSRKKQI